jgi:hypothetical protein
MGEGLSLQREAIQELSVAKTSEAGGKIEEVTGFRPRRCRLKGPAVSMSIDR